MTMSFKYAKITAKYRSDFGELGKIVEQDETRGFCLRLADGTLEWFSTKEVKTFNPFVSTKRQPLFDELLLVMSLKNALGNPVLSELRREASLELTRQFKMTPDDFQVMLYRSGVTLGAFEELKRGIA